MGGQLDTAWFLSCLLTLCGHMTPPRTGPLTDHKGALSRVGGVAFLPACFFVVIGSHVSEIITEVDFGLFLVLLPLRSKC